MSPDRQRTSTGSPKPYSRPTTPDASPTRRSVDHAEQETSQPIAIASKPGFPTHEQYKQIEARYLHSITANKREKAIISQATFDRIWAVLNTYDTTTESPQFRFWARKKFTLGKLKKAAEGKSDEDVKPQTVLLHEQNLVAVREQIYDILCYGHGISNHGGRDKTMTSIRAHYTWIPKELVAQFIKACPTCIAKKCGMKTGDELSAKSLRQYLRGLGAFSDSGDEEDARKVTKSKFRARLKASKEKPITPAVAPASVPLDREGNKTAPAQVRVIQSAPMSREVSLYQGLPNGWQFRHNDISAAQKEFISSKNTPHISSSSRRSGRPRVPSIVPVMRAFSEPPPGNYDTLSSLLHSNDIEVECVVSPSSRPLIPALQTILGSPETDSSLSDASSSDISSASASSSVSVTRPVSLPSINRISAPTSIDLQTLSSQKTIQAFLDGQASNSGMPSGDSPPLSASRIRPRSDSSALSTLAMVAAESISTANTELLTPVDSGEGPGDVLGKDLAQQTRLLMLNMNTEAVCDHGLGVLIL